MLIIIGFIVLAILGLFSLLINITMATSSMFLDEEELKIIKKEEDDLI